MIYLCVKILLTHKEEAGKNMYDNMLDLRKAALECKRCGLCETRTNVVFGVGNEKADVMFVGEGPGKNEDLKGEPFVGRAGELLDKMLLAAGFSRAQNIYIANMVKCRPPENRDPYPEEIESCIGFLRNQVKLINPRYIVCLGRVAAQNIIAKDIKVTKSHGEFIQKDGAVLMATFHPAALLRNPNNKPDAFDDLLKLRDRLEKEPSPVI